MNKGDKKIDWTFKNRMDENKALDNAADSFNRASIGCRNWHYEY